MQCSELHADHADHVESTGSAIQWQHFTAKGAKHSADSSARRCSVSESCLSRTATTARAPGIRQSVQHLRGCTPEISLEISENISFPPAFSPCPTLSAPAQVEAGGTTFRFGCGSLNTANPSCPSTHHPFPFLSVFRASSLDPHSSRACCASRIPSLPPSPFLSAPASVAAKQALLSGRLGWRRRRDGSDGADSNQPRSL